jgi:hypothetical protein
MMLTSRNRSPAARWIALTGLLLVLLLIGSGFTAHPVQANSAPPPGVVWLVFDNQAGERSLPDGIQITGCLESGCTDPVLLLQYGICNLPGCLESEPFLSDVKDDVYLTFDCAGDRCRATAFDFTFPYFGLVLQSGELTHAISANYQLPVDYGEELEWLVTFSDQTVQIKPIAFNANETSQQESLWLYLGLTLGCELIVGGLFFWLACKETGRNLWLRLLMIVLVNLVTFPVVWYFFPALRQFTPNAERIAGIFILAMSVFYSALLWYIYFLKSQRTRRILILLSLLLIPITIYCVGMVYFAVGYVASYRMYAQGWSTITTIIVSEMYAFLWEGMLYWILSNRRMTVSKAFLASFLMNLSSLLIGLLPTLL